MFEWYDPTIHGTVADWVSGIGTLLAIVVSLYLSLKDNYKQLLVNMYQNFLFDQNFKVTDDSYYSIEVINNGKIPINITKIGFCRFRINALFPKYLRNKFPKYFGFLKIYRLDPEGDSLPIMVNSQEVKSFIFRGVLDKEKQNEVANKSLVFAQDSTGKLYFSKERIRI